MRSHGMRRLRPLIAITLALAGTFATAAERTEITLMRLSALTVTSATSAK